MPVYAQFCTLENIASLSPIFKLFFHRQSVFYWLYSRYGQVMHKTTYCKYGKQLRAISRSEPI